MQSGLYEISRKPGENCAHHVLSGREPRHYKTPIAPKDYPAHESAVRTAQHMGSPGGGSSSRQQGATAHSGVGRPLGLGVAIKYEEKGRHDQDLVSPLSKPICRDKARDGSGASPGQRASQPAAKSIGSRREAL